MSERDDGGPAFPIASDLIGHAPGMTLRDWFAGQVILGLVSHTLSTISLHDRVKTAYLVADAMLEARK